MVAINSQVRRVSEVLAVRALRAATSARIRRIVPRELVMFSGRALQGDKDLDGPPRGTMGFGWRGGLRGAGACAMLRQL